VGYVAVKGGTQAIEASIERLAWERLRAGRVLDVADVEAGLRALIDQVMSEASLYDPTLAAIALKQAEGSPEEAVFILRAYRSTLPRRHYSEVVAPDSMRVERRISAAFKEIPGGQILGASPDYTHRLLDLSLTEETPVTAGAWVAHYEAAIGIDGRESRFGSDGRAAAPAGHVATPAADRDGALRVPKVLDYLRAQGLMRPVARDDREPDDVTKRSLEFPTSRSARLQVLTRGQTGAVTALAYASLRGYGPMLHPTVAELRVGTLPLAVPDPFGDDAASEQTTRAAAGDAPHGGDRRRDARDDSYYIGEIRVTEVESVVPMAVPRATARARCSSISATASVTGATRPRRSR